MDIAKNVQNKKTVKTIYLLILEKILRKKKKNGSGSVQYWNGFEVYNFDSKSLDYDPECYREALKEYGKTY